MNRADGWDGPQLGFHTGSPVQQSAVMLLRPVPCGNSDASLTLNLLIGGGR